MGRTAGRVVIAAAVLGVGSVATGCSSSSGGTPGTPEAGSQEAAVREAAATSGSSAPDVFVPLGCPVPDALNGYALPAYVPAKRAPTACSKQDILDYSAACITSMQAPKDCPVYRQTHATCAGCLESASTDPAWGPLVFWPNGQTELNTSGCLELLSSGTACATKVQAIDQCSHAACDVTCAQAPPYYMDVCTKSAYSGPCMMYASASVCEVADAAGTPEALCQVLAGGSLSAQVQQVAPYFCGGAGAATGDAGTTPDAGTASPPDSSTGGGGADAPSGAPRDAARGG
ncbi:MAG: hypothetical protein M3O36_04845 [Myxococcota bacterium]|nr:hypothetical protein [Myxococcota bacterium]